MPSVCWDGLGMGHQRCDADVWQRLDLELVESRGDQEHVAVEAIADELDGVHRTERRLHWSDFQPIGECAGWLVVAPDRTWER